LDSNRIEENKCKKEVMCIVGYFLKQDGQVIQTMGFSNRAIHMDQKCDTRKIDKQMKFEFGLSISRMENL